MEIQIPHEIHETHSFFSPKKKLLPSFFSSFFPSFLPSFLDILFLLLSFHSLPQDSLNKFLCFDTSFSLHTLFRGIRRLLSNFVSTEEKKSRWMKYLLSLLFSVSRFLVIVYPMKARYFCTIRSVSLLQFSRLYLWNLSTILLYFLLDPRAVKVEKVCYWSGSWQWF